MWALFFSVASAVGASVTAAAPSQADERHCDVAWAYIEHELGRLPDRLVVFDTQADRNNGSVDHYAEWVAFDDDRMHPAQSPPPDLSRAWPDGPTPSAVRACASIRLRLDGRHIRYGRQAAAWAARPDHDGLFRAGIYLVSLPLMSPDGRDAILSFSAIWGPQDAAGVLVHMVQRADGAWMVSGELGIWGRNRE